MPAPVRWVIRPEIVGTALREISKDRQSADVMFDVLELNRLLESQARITLLPHDATRSFLGSQLATKD